MLAAVCSRSQGQSRRSRSVRRCSSRRAAAGSSPAVISAGGRRRGGRRRRRGRRRLVARLVLDLALEVLRHLREPGLPRRLLLLRGEIPLDLRLDLLEGLGVRGLDRAEGLDDVVAVDALHRLRDLVRLERERGLVERGHRLLTGTARTSVRDAKFAALGRRAGVLRVLLRESGEARSVFQLRLDLVGEALAVDEDVPHLARLRRRERRLVLVVVLLRRGVRHLDVRRHLGLELLAQEVRPEFVLLELGEGDVVLLQRVLELLLVALVVRLLDLLDLLVDVLLRHRHAELLGLLRHFFLLHEEGDSGAAERRVSRGADLGTRLLLGLVARAGHAHQRGEARLRDGRGVDLRDRVGRYGARVAATAARGEQGNEAEAEDEGQGQEGQASLHFHPVRSMSREAPLRRSGSQAARRASKIASTSSTAWAISSCPRMLTSCLDETYMAVFARSRSSRNSPEPSTSRPTVAFPLWKTR